MGEHRCGADEERLPAEDRACARREKLKAGLRQDDLEAFLIAAPTNVRYLTGFTGDSSVLVLAPRRAVIVSDGRFTTQLAEECPGLESYIRPPGQEMNAALAHVVQTTGLRRLGFESSAWTVADYHALREAVPTAELVPLSGRVEELRQIKDEGEVEAVRQAVRCAERAFVMLRAGLRAQDSEQDVADALEGYLRRCGASGASFPPIVAVGVRSALPHASPRSDVRLADDEFVLIDWGATGCPYKSDLTRVVVTGKVTPKFEAIYRIVLTALDRGIAAIRPGVTAHDADAQARAVIEEAGFGPFFSHGLGHGLGMDIHEAPRIRRGCEVPLAPGMVITLEPGIYLPDWGGIRIEDDVLVTPDGCEVLSRLPKSLESIRVE
jgi:Xaa-Pro aminopeptidase